MKLFRGSQSSADAGDEDTGKQGLFARLRKTRSNLSGGLYSLFSRPGKIDEALYDEIQDQLIMADVGVAGSEQIMDLVRQDVRHNNLGDSGQLLESMRKALQQVLGPCESPLDVQAGPRPFVILMVGVNGVGKTTTVAKLAGHLAGQGFKVMMAACDTFRAAAIEQLQSWGERLDIPVIAQSHGADAAAVAFDAYSAACARDMDVLLIDTAGRQHTHGDLMEQLKKVRRVLQKCGDDVPAETLLTVDAGNGQNVISQVTSFQEAVGLDGLCVTKLDGTARGGVVVALADRFGLPIRFIGVGEGVDDLRPFVVSDFVDALLPESLGEEPAGGD